MLTNRSFNEHEQRTIQEIAKALLKAIQDQGHICLKAETIAALAADMETVKSLVPKVDAMAVDIAAIKGQWKGVGIALTVIAILPTIGWLWSLLASR
jgi:hypothetical protein